MGGLDVSAHLRAVCAFVLAALAGCAPGVDVTAEDIVGGGASSDAFVVALVARRVRCDDPAQVVCSGALVAPRVVLTAAHCVARFELASEIEVFFGADVTGPGTFIVAQASALHPGYDPSTGVYDLAMLALATNAPSTASVATLPTTTVDTLAAGTTLRVAGFGTTDATMDLLGQRRTATMTLGAVRMDAFDAAPLSGLSCHGDSGGPVLATIAGSEQIVGITASGDSTCHTTATQARVDVALTSFVRPTIDAMSNLGPPWPSSAIPLDQVGTRPCAMDTDCPALMRCDQGSMRCALPALGPVSFGASCTTAAMCGADLCARVWPDGADACHCTHMMIAPPPMGGARGGCSVATGSAAPLAFLFLFAALAVGRFGARRGALAVALAGIAAAFLLWPRRDPDASDAGPIAVETASEPEQVPTEHSATEIDAGARAPRGDAGARSTAVTASDLVGLTIAEQAELLGDDDLSDGLDLPAPPPPFGAPATPIAQVGEDPARVLEQREAGLHLLDTSIERLSHEASELERSGDSEGAARARVRAERMTALRARRGEELETLRAGGTLPNAVGPGGH
jgi:V8-like Glu-specific endopeptidase